MNLQPLRIEAGWHVTYNQLYEIDPKPGVEHFFEGSSLVVLQNNRRLTLIDVSWRPEQALNGAYHLHVLHMVENFNADTNTFDYDVNWEKPLAMFTIKTREKLVEKLEHLMRTLPVKEDPRMTIRRGVVDEQSEVYRLRLIAEGLSMELIKKIIANGRANIQNHLLDQYKITREILLLLAAQGCSKKIRNKAEQKLKSKEFKA